MSSVDTITAITTPPGIGGVSIIRVSGPEALLIAERICKQTLPPRLASFTPFYDVNDTIIDEGLAIYFKAPHSFTGEDVVEFQGHGGPVVSDQLLNRVTAAGARLARPGEFSERAFLNDKIDLIQAEAIADLINARTTQAAQSAMRSLQGEFSQKIDVLLEQLIKMRMFIESAIDFTDEDIDFIESHDIINQLKNILLQLEAILKTASQGALLQTGIHVVIAGAPNAGKSSLLNCLSGRDAAIVTDVAGTTRDILREQISIDGIPLHIIDTAGLRDTNDSIEKEGVKRATQAIEKADLILWVVDVTAAEQPQTFPTHIPMIKVKNKIDLKPDVLIEKNEVGISAKQQQYIDVLKEKIKNAVGVNSQESSPFIARRRHIDALKRTCDAITRGLHVYQETKAQELLAEELRQAQQALGEVTGAYTTDDLLGKIFSEFCIGK